MSAYTVAILKIRSREALLKALADLGFTNVEVHDEAQHLYGYQGDRRAQKANVIIRRKYVGHAANDIGFERNADGTYTAHISEYDAGKYGNQWKQKLMANYNRHHATDTLKSRGFIEAKKEEHVMVGGKMYTRILFRK